MPQLLEQLLHLLHDFSNQEITACIVFSHWSIEAENH